jgi:hypothetical protein
MFSLASGLQGLSCVEAQFLEMRDVGISVGCKWRILWVTAGDGPTQPHVAWRQHSQDNCLV